MDDGRVIGRNGIDSTLNPARAWRDWGCLKGYARITGECFILRVIFRRADDQLQAKDIYLLLHFLWRCGGVDGCIGLVAVAFVRGRMERNAP